MGFKEWLALDKLGRLRAIIKWNGGFTNSLKRLHYHDDLKIGALVGIDQYGNRYFENNFYFFGRNRWVEYNPTWGYDYDASMIPPEWFGWLHYRTDLTPCEDPSRPRYPWIKPHVINLSGTPYEYVPYDTTRPKIEAWRPKSKKQCENELPTHCDLTQLESSDSGSSKCDPNCDHKGNPN